MSRTATLESQLPVGQLMALVARLEAAGDFREVPPELRRNQINSVQFRTQAFGHFRIVPVDSGRTSRTGITVDGYCRVTPKPGDAVGSQIALEVDYDTTSLLVYGVPLLGVVGAIYYGWIHEGTPDWFDLFRVLVILVSAIGAVWYAGQRMTARVWDGLLVLVDRLSDGSILPSSA